MKTCTTCGEAKPLDAFGPHATGKDGLRADCRECHAAAMKAARADQPQEERNAAQAAYRAGIRIGACAICRDARIDGRGICRDCADLVDAIGGLDGLKRAVKAVRWLDAQA